MAIQKQLTMTDGNQGNYWRVDVITDNVLRGKCSVVLNLYKDAALADDAKGSPVPGEFVMDSINVSLEGAEYPLNDTNLNGAGKTPAGEVYKEIRQLTNVRGIDFSSGQDV